MIRKKLLEGNIRKQQNIRTEIEYKSQTVFIVKKT